MLSWYTYLLQHKEIFASLVLAIIAVLKLTAWGRSQASALDSVVRVIEGLDATDVKDAVARQHETLPAGAKDALGDAVATADPKKETPSLSKRIFREIFRGVLFGK